MDRPLPGRDVFQPIPVNIVLSKTQIDKIRFVKELGEGSRDHAFFISEERPVARASTCGGKRVNSTLDDASRSSNTE